MVEEAGYEIMPYKEVVELRRQIEELRQKTGDTNYRDLLNSIASLTESMRGMLELFKTAAEEMRLEEKEGSMIAQKVEPLFEKVDQLLDQNKTIADGMVAIADLVREMKEGTGAAPQMPQQKAAENSFPPHPFGAPTGAVPQGMLIKQQIPGRQPQKTNFSMPPPMPNIPPPLKNDFSIGSMPPPPLPAGPIGDASMGFNDELMDIPELPKKRGLFSMFKKP